MRKLTRQDKISGTITTQSGLHIGASKDAVKIGGLDSPVIKHPITEKPYIPGSSLKGKLRSLLELRKGLDDVCGCGECEICCIFGSGNHKTKKSPTRIIVRDAVISEKSPFEPEITEEKYENKIDRNSGITTRGSLRQIERVVEGTIFEFEIIIRVFEGDPDYLLVIKNALSLLEKDYLGGMGSRGYGKVKIDC